MAVSGRKEGDFRGSISRSSAEDFDKCCEPCLTEGQHIEAFRYCVDCQEYLCKNCVRYHQKTKVLKHHQLIENDQANKHTPATGSSETCTEKCSTHRNEVIKFFCPKHEALGCNDCMTMEHRTCKLDYIPDKCKDVGNSQEYNEIMKTLDEKLKDIDDLMTRATARDEEIDICHERVIQAIGQFRKEINDHLDTLQKKIEEDVNKKKSMDKQKIKTVIEACIDNSTSMVQVKSSLQEKKSANLNMDLFIALKQTKQKCQSDAVKEAETVLDKTDVQYTFERKAEIESILSTQDFGKLTQVTKPLTSVSKGLMLSHKADINMRIDTDTEWCYITGCAVLSHEKVAVADQNNKNVKVVDVNRKVITDYMKLDSYPWGLARLTNDQMAVTVPIKQSILIMTINGKLETSRTLNISRYCYGIVYNKGSLLVLCQNPNSVVILDLHGNVKNSFSLSDKQFQKKPYDMAFNADSKLLYISDWRSNSIVSLSMQGQVCASLEKNELSEPRGILVLHDGSLLVCSRGNNAIYKVSADLKQTEKIAVKLSSPVCVDYNKQRNEVYIASESSDMLQTFFV